MEQAVISLPLGVATLTVPAEEATRILLERFIPGAVQPKPENAVPRIGELWPEQGGVYAGQMRGVDGAADYHLVVAAGDEGQQAELEWGGSGEEEPGATSEWDGKANTAVLVASANEHPAAEWAAGLSVSGHHDWYLAARRESALCYANLPELFDKAWYWTSTQYSPDDAWLQYFYNGSQGSHGKHGVFRVRAVRRVLSL